MGSNPSTDDVRISETWSANRAHLVDLGFGILGDVGAAEDAVQEAFARLVGVEYDRIEDARGWLTVVTSRICFDKIRSAPSRREHTYDAAVLDAAGTGHVGTAPGRNGAGDPADRVTLDDEVRLALLVVLQRLSPAERVVFVLHDVFQMPFDTIAETVGRSTPNCRQLARRARSKVDSEKTGRPPVSSAESRRVAERFIQACSTGDVSGLLALLDPDVSGEVDLGPHDPRTGTVRQGSDVVAENLLRFFGNATLVSSPVREESIVLAFIDRKLYALILLTPENDLLKEIHVLADPVKIGFLDAQLSPTA
ncbi:MAG TPA: RNA polymerase sigma factor SigI [Acidimicrobiales bacterium]